MVAVVAWLPSIHAPGPSEQGCSICNKIALAHFHNLAPLTVWLAQHEAAGHVPQPGADVQDQDGQETRVYL